MKRIIAAWLALLCLLSFSACNEKKKPESHSSAIDLEYFSDMGSIPESTYKIGQDISVMISELEKNAVKEESGGYHDIHCDDRLNYSVIEADGYTCVQTGTFDYLYRDKSKGVSCIISYAGAYKFKNGTVSIEIKDAFSEYKSEEYDTDSKNIFFLPGATYLSCIKYRFEKNDIVFIFVENALAATAVYDNKEWSF